MTNFHPPQYGEILGIGTDIMKERIRQGGFLQDLTGLRAELVACAAGLISCIEMIDQLKKAPPKEEAQ